MSTKESAPHAIVFSHGWVLSLCSCPEAFHGMRECSLVFDMRAGAQLPVLAVRPEPDAIRRGHPSIKCHLPPGAAASPEGTSTCVLGLWRCRSLTAQTGVCHPSS